MIYIRLVYPLFATFLDWSLMAASVELHAMAVEHTEYAGSALVAAYLPDVIYGVAGVVHVDYGLLPVKLQTCFQRPWMSLLA